MASPAELMQTVSDATGVPLATVIDIDRKLVKAGLRTKGGRGLNFARMKPFDAATLLTAILASPQANSAAVAVDRYRETRVDAIRSSEGRFGHARLDDLADLPSRHSFVDALAALIESVVGGSIARLAEEAQQNWIPHVEVFAFTRATRGRIRITNLPNGLTASVEYIFEDRSRAGFPENAAILSSPGASRNRPSFLSLNS